ncbi:hypothetical protein CR513_44563, partial [Mucuna pruriens]
MCRYRILNLVVIDNDTQFVSKTLHNFMNTYRLRIRMSTLSWTKTIQTPSQIETLDSDRDTRLRLESDWSWTRVRLELDLN